MIVQLPMPYPDEIFYSVIARYRAHCGLRTRDSRAPMFGKGVILGVDLPSGLTAMAGFVAPVWAVTAEDIVRRYSLFPYYASFNTAEISTRILDQMLNRCSGARRQTLGMPMAVTGHRHLVYCPSCRHEDVSEYGETYWRRLHQLPGVLICERHGCFLTKSRASITVGSNPEFHPAGGPLDQHFVPSVASFNAPPALTTAIAQRTRQLLHGLETEWSGEDRFIRYRRRLVQLGLESRPGVVAYPRAASAIKDYFGLDFLNSLGGRGIYEPLEWLPLVLALAPHKYCHPLAHILLQTFLERVPTTRSGGISYAVGPWVCPNPYFKHAVSLPVRGRFSKPRRDGRRVVSAKCNCGMHFTFTLTDDQDPSVPIIDTVRKLAPSLALQISCMRRSGLTLRHIADELRLPINCLKRYSRTPELIEGLESRRTSLREAWLGCLARTPGQNRSIARNGNRRLYAELAALDPVWLSKQGSKNTRLPSITEEGWRERDLKWSAKLKQVAASACGTESSRKFTKVWFRREAGLPSWTFGRLNRLPLCRIFFSSVGQFSFIRTL